MSWGPPYTAVVTRSPANLATVTQGPAGHEGEMQPGLDGEVGLLPLLQGQLPVQLLLEHGEHLGVRGGVLLSTLG